MSRIAKDCQGLPRIAKKNLHEEDVFVAVVAQHIVVDLCNDSISVLPAINTTMYKRSLSCEKIDTPVEEANVGGVDFVLVLNGGYEAGD